MANFQRAHVGWMSFQHFLEMSSIYLHVGLLQAIVERYKVEIGTIVTRVAEWVLSLEDMICFTGLQAHGEPIKCTLQERCYTPAEMASLLADAPGIVRSRLIRARWLRQCLGSELAQELGKQADRELHIFLLYFFGSMLFPTAATIMNVTYIQLVVDLRVTEFCMGNGCVDLPP